MTTTPSGLLLGVHGREDLPAWIRGCRTLHQVQRKVGAYAVEEFHVLTCAYRREGQ